MKKISSLNFILLFALYLLVVNFIFFNRVYTFLPDIEKFKIVPLILAGFSICLLILSLLFVKFLTKPLSILIALISGVCGYFMYAYGIVVDTEMIANAAQTDALEVKNLLNIKFFIWLFFFAILPTIFIVKIKIEYFSLLKELKLRAILIAFALVSFGAVYATFSKTYIPLFRKHADNIRPYTLPFYPIYSAVLFATDSLKTPPHFVSFKNNVLKDKEQNSLLVFIIGETQRSANYSLNGYSKNETNLYTKNIENLVSFTTFYSCGTNTAVSLPCMLSDLDRKRFSRGEAKFRQNLIQILMEAGVDVYWFGNNSGGCKGVCDDLDESHKVELKARGMDREIFNLAKDVKVKERPTAIFLHIQGSHGPAYFKDYEVAKFKPTCDTADLSSCTSSQIVNTYDNSILYQDELQSDLIAHLKSFGDDKKIFFLFVSDHGESLGENGLYLHSIPYAIAPDFQKRVPALFWFNDAKMSGNFQTMKDSYHSHDNLFHTILGFFKIESEAYDKNLDMFMSVKE